MPAEPPRTSKPGPGDRNLRGAVTVWREEISLPTYTPGVPDRNPMFLEKRVYQGSSGRVYPLPFTDRVAETASERRWKAVWVENEFLKVLVLPEIGGRIHRLIDKTNSYDLIYFQPVIKPALVGLAGPWVSGGIEFNWPQHHRPATFLPVEVEIEKHVDGSRTVWCSDHDPMSRMKGMHGICLHPEKAFLELKVRVYNRTPFIQTFLWWANVATRVHEAYRSFFPPDVFYVADHARRSLSEYPLARGYYYGVNYGHRERTGVPESEVPRQFVPHHCRKSSASGTSRERGLAYAPNDLSFYANIPTPCSYMCMGSEEDFFGGYDYQAQAGLVHVANHHISPGKKQWTWGNHEFGYAWDRNLTDADPAGEYRPYIELMAGVYTDNQPDFSFLQPGETKTWSQHWYPIQRIGPVQEANADAAMSLEVTRKLLRAGVCVTRTFRGATVRLERADGSTITEWKADLVAGRPFIRTSRRPEKGWKNGVLSLRVIDRRGLEIIAFQRKPVVRQRLPPPATEPPLPGDIQSADELYLTGLHLEQYRHATRCPTVYWHEALRRDPGDSRCNNALGLWHLRRGEFAVAERHFRSAIQRLTLRNANPRDGEAYYNLGLCLRYLEREHEAYAAFYKATWNEAWAGAGYHALAEIDCLREDWPIALEHLDHGLRHNIDNLRARNLKVVVLRQMGEVSAAESVLRDTRRLDPLDAWSQYLDGRNLTCDLQTQLDVAHDKARAGFYADAIRLLKAASAVPRDLPDQSWGALPLLHYTLGWLEHKRGLHNAAVGHFKKAARLPSDYCFPARLEEIAILKCAIRENPRDPRAPYYLGNLLYDRRRHEEAIRLWEQSLALDPDFSIAWRNLAVGCFNVRHQAAKARAAYNAAIRADPADARLLYERDQLSKRLREKPERRLRALELRLDLVRQRDDLSIELCALYNQTGQHEKALELLDSRKFQPWEGGEGGPLGQHVRSRLALGRQALRQAASSVDASQHPDRRNQAVASAVAHFRAALTSPANLGEASHLLANQSDIHYWLGCALSELGETTSAREQWLSAATFKGDFQEMSVRAFSEMTYYSALAWERLGRKSRAAKLLRELLTHALKLQRSKATIDYFATSLPSMLLFEDDLQFRQETTALFLQAQAWGGLGQIKRARRLLRRVLRRDPSYAAAADLLASWDLFGPHLRRHLVAAG